MVVDHVPTLDRVLTFLQVQQFCCFQDLFGSWSSGKDGVLSLGFKVPCVPCG